MFSRFAFVLLILNLGTDVIIYLKSDEPQVHGTCLSQFPLFILLTMPILLNEKVVILPEGVHLLTIGCRKQKSAALDYAKLSPKCRKAQYLLDF